MFDGGPGHIAARTTGAAHDWWKEELWGWSQFGGLVLALVAGLFAFFTWRQGKASAELAREELEMLKDEANRRAKIEIRSIKDSRSRAGGSSFSSDC